MSNAEIKTYAKELAGKLNSIAALQDEAKDIIASAKDAGINTKALRKVARELVMDSDKRAKLYDDEEQIDMFRFQVGLLDEKSDKSVAVASKVREQKFVEAVQGFDELAGSNISGDYLEIREKLRSNEVAKAKVAAE